MTNPTDQTAAAAESLAHLQRARLEYDDAVRNYRAGKRGATLVKVDRAWARLQSAYSDHAKATAVLANG